MYLSNKEVNRYMENITFEKQFDLDLFLSDLKVNNLLDDLRSKSNYLYIFVYMVESFNFV